MTTPSRSARRIAWRPFCGRSLRIVSISLCKSTITVEALYWIGRVGNSSIAEISVPRSNSGSILIVKTPCWRAKSRSTGTTEANSLAVATPGPFGIYHTLPNRGICFSIAPIANSPQIIKRGRQLASRFKFKKTDPCSILPRSLLWTTRLSQRLISSSVAKRIAITIV